MCVLFLRMSLDLKTDEDHLWERACLRWRRVSQHHCQLERPPSSERRPDQARSHKGLVDICQRLVGWQAAFAGKPASTGDWWTSASDWSAVRPPSRASPLPQGIGVICQRLVGWQAAFAGKPAPTGDWWTSASDWSAGRPPSRASSLPQRIGGHLPAIGRLAGRLRGQARSHRGLVDICQRLVGWQAAKVKIKRSQPRCTRQLLQGIGVHPLLTTHQAER